MVDRKEEERTEEDRKEEERKEKREGRRVRRDGAVRRIESWNGREY